jgi:membrane protease subunit (stomatin/prohibitin family)
MVRHKSCMWWFLADSERRTTRTGLLPRLDNLAARTILALLVDLYWTLTGIVCAMALFSREFIAVPDDRKGQIVFKWPDVTIRRFTHAIVNADQVAMFVNTGQVVQTMGPGRHPIDADELPGLGSLVDFATGGNAYRAELYFVGTREYTGFRFGGRVDDVEDPRTGLVVTLRVFGDYALRVIDPARLITNLTATVDVTDNERIAGWVSDQLLKVLRTNVTTQVIANGWPILGLSVHSPEIEQAAITSANGQLEAYGLALTRMGNFDINLAPEDEKQLKQLAKDTSYSRLAGGFQQYAAGEMALGAGQGMAQGGGATEGAFLAAGFALPGMMAGAMQQQQHPAPQAPPPAPAPAAPAPTVVSGPACASCSTTNPAGAKFCMGCGTPLAPAVKHCTECGNELPGAAKFCANCGTRAG